MSEPKTMLSCQNVSIRYMVGDFKNIGLKEWVMRRLTGNYKVVDFWADRDVTFSIDHGDMLGIIGANGAGKSTLLKVISGMKSRLAFSIASLVKPEILILDEVLSVGDGAFRAKSEAKMREIIKGGATTILVSHSLGQVREMCNKVLWLDKGRQVEFTDDVNGCCDRYEAFLRGR